MAASLLAGLGDISEFRFTAGPKQIELGVVSFSGEEAVSRPYRFDIELAGAPGEENLKDKLIGVTGTLTIRDRSIKGYISAVECLGTFEGTGRARYRVRLVPKLWRLSQVHRSRIFQDLSVREVVAKVCKDSDVTAKWQTKVEYAKREYIVQYQESDLAFISRLAADEGIFFLALDDDTVVFADTSKDSCVRVEHQGIPYRNPSGLLPSEEAVYEVAAHHRVAPATCVVHDFNFENPALKLTAQQEVGKAAPGVDSKLEVYEHECKHLDPDVGAKRAQVRLEELRVSEHLVGGSSQCRGFAAGDVFALTDHPSWDGKYVLVEVFHEGWQRQVLGAEAAAAGLGKDGYRNRFNCIPHAVPLRAPHRERRIVQCTETATVVGPKGEEIHTDKYGRIKVLFHWDREGKGDELSSCWIRVVQSWAGAGWGTIFLPRVGMEVLIAFVSGDPDRPVVIGCLYNGSHPPPYPLPANKTRSTIKTETTPGGGGSNELRFEDAKGSQEVYLHAEKDLNEVVKNQHSLSVGASQSYSVGGDQTIGVTGNRCKTVKKDETTTVKGDRKETVEGNDTFVVLKDRKTAITLGETVGCKTRAICIETTDTLDTKDCTVHVTGTFATKADTKYELTQGGTTYMLEGGKVDLNAAGAITIHHGSGSVEIDASGKVTVTGGPAVELHSGGCTIKLSNGAVEIDAPQKIKLGCGSSSIELSPAGVTTTGAKVSSSAMTTNEISGAMVKIN